jgi:1-acyl-sn-glycerol-3-phosphate acyltransferase
MCRWYGKPMTWLQSTSFSAVRDFTRYWNNYEVHGLEKLQNMDGNCLLVGYHSRCTVDLVYVLVALQPGVIATHMMFKIPLMGWLLSQVNIFPSGTDGNAEKGFIEALCSKRPVLLLPGGVYECIKPLSQIGKIQWKPVPGFARIIHEQQELLGTKTKVVPFYTKNCEQSMYRSDFIYETFGLWGSRMYDMFRRGHYWLMPVMLSVMFISVGFKVLPRPVKLDTYLGDAVVLRKGESAESFSGRVSSATQALVDRVEALPQVESEYSRLCRSKRASDRVLLAKLCVETCLVGTYTVIQNLCVVVMIFLLIWLPVIVAYFLGRAMYEHFVAS